MSDKPNAFLKVEDAANIQESIENAKKNGYQGIITPVINCEYRREFVNNALGIKQQCFTRSPLILCGYNWIDEVIPHIKPPNLGVKDEEIRINNERMLEQEINFALHLKLSGCILINLSNNDPEAVGKVVQSCLQKASSFDGRLLIELPMVDIKKLTTSNCNDLDDLLDELTNDNQSDQWNIWYKFYAATGFHTQIELALVMTPDLPSDEELRRWLGEQVGMLIIPTHCYISNKNFYPILPKPLQVVATMFMQYARCMKAIEPRGDESTKLDIFLEFIEKGHGMYVENNVHSFFEDCLRYPLQPLYDNLDTSTYETFESDPAKYILYQRAIEAALVDKVAESEIETKKLVLMVLGAGRGPLVRAAINASKNTKRKLKILVVEKNPNAIVTLTNLIDVLWKTEDITLISSDMRMLVLEEKADILVSELLGSFGDNELSPECLDGAQNLLKPEGINIPSDSKSYLRPVMTHKIHNQFTRGNTSTKTLYLNPKEVNWLINLSSVYYIDEPKDLFMFVHPDKSEVIDNSRHKTLQFKAKLDCLLHGFSGYFTSTLYKDIQISIHPASHTPGMVSWYPIYFPVANPTFIEAGETITVDFWRKVEQGKKVWYEWQTQDRPVQNSEGETHPIFL